MQEFGTYEMTITQKNEGKWVFFRVGLILFYTVVVLAVLFLGFKTRILWPVLALIPVGVWMLVFVTWRYVAVEYEYSIASGVLTFSKIYGGRSRKRIFELPLRDAVRIAPLSSDTERQTAEHYHPEVEFSGISSLRAPNLYFILFEKTSPRKKEARRAIFYFEGDPHILRLCRYYNPSSTVIDTTIN